MSGPQPIPPALHPIIHPPDPILTPCPHQPAPQPLLWTVFTPLFSNMQRWHFGNWAAPTVCSRMGWEVGGQWLPHFSLPGLPALVVAISVGFTKAKGYSTIN